MKLDHTIPELDADGLRRFGLITGGLVAVLFGVFFPWILNRGWPIWPWVIFGLLGAAALIAPRALKPIYKGWMRFGLLASRVTTPIILGIVFFLVISPMGWIRRLVGRDAMQRTFEPERDSYRVPSKPQPVENMEKPY